MIKAMLLSRPVDWLVRLALRIRQAQLKAVGLSDVEAMSKRD